jgi:hypothetical protein
MSMLAALNKIEAVLLRRLYNERWRIPSVPQLRSVNHSVFATANDNLQVTLPPTKLDIPPLLHFYPLILVR